MNVAYNHVTPLRDAGISLYSSEALIIARLNQADLIYLRDKRARAK
jgi:hypothetical protein